MLDRLPWKRLNAYHYGLRNRRTLWQGLLELDSSSKSGSVYFKLFDLFGFGEARAEV